MQQAMREKQKISMDVEALLRWAYVDELSKRQTSAAEGIWRHMEDYANHGGIDNGHAAAQRYCHFGLPDADAERVEVAVSALPDTVIDWGRHFEEIAADLAGLISINDLSPQGDMSRLGPKVGWGGAGTKALKAFFGDAGAQPVRDRRRDVLMVGGFKTGVLVTTHAIKGTRPDWDDEQPRPQMTPMPRGPNAMIVGECRGKNLYTAGSYCPLVWSPSALTIISGRIEYFSWYQGLVRLSDTLALERFEVLSPKAPRLPWIDNDEWNSRIVPVAHTGRNNVRDWGTLPLTPIRPRAGPPRGRRAKDPGRSISDLP